MRQTQFCYVMGGVYVAPHLPVSLALLVAGGFLVLAIVHERDEARRAS